MSVKPGNTLCILVELGQRQWWIPLGNDPIGIGRSENNFLRIEQEPQLAPRHLKFFSVNGEIWVKDMGSPEGFLHNDHLTREALLKPGDEIVVGNLKAVLLIEERMPTGSKSEASPKRISAPDIQKDWLQRFWGWLIQRR